MEKIKELLNKVSKTAPKLADALNKPYHHPGQWDDGEHPLDEMFGNYTRLEFLCERNYDLTLIQGLMLNMYKHNSEYQMNDIAVHLIREAFKEANKISSFGMTFKALVKKPGENLQFIDGIKNELNWLKKDGQINDVGHYTVGDYCFLFDDLGHLHHRKNGLKYNCNICNKDNMIFGNLYVTKYNIHGEDEDITEKDLEKIQKLVFEMNEDEAERHHKFLNSIWGFIDEEEE